MASLEFFLVVESVSVDQGTNRVSLFHVLEDLQFETFPGILPQLVAVSSWNIDPAEEMAGFPLALHVHPPGEGVEPTRFEMLLEPANALRRRSFFTLLGFSFSEAGSWRFEILRNGRHEANHFVTVMQGLIGVSPLQPEGHHF